MGIPAFLIAADAERRGAGTVAARTGLRLTEANYPMVARYVRITNRWRTLGLMTAALVYLAALNHDTIMGPYFLGWFIGNLLAEFHLLARPTTPNPPPASPPLATPPTAVTSTAPAGTRLPLRLMSRPAVVFLWLGPLLCLLAVGAAVSLWPTATPRKDLITVLVLDGLSVVVSAAALVLVWVLRRRAVVGPPDLAAADVAIRSRSARTLATGGAVFGLFVFGTADSIGLRLPESTLLPWLLFMIGIPAAALLIGLRGSTIAQPIQAPKEAMPLT